MIRREVGGGAVYLDGNQLFTQWIFHAEHLPATVEARFELYIDTLVRTYRALGIAADYRPINDIHVNGRKIGGTGAARMDRAEVVVGSLMFDFDTATMAQVLRVPSEKFRDKVRQSLDDYMTTMRRELGRAAAARGCRRGLPRPAAPSSSGGTIVPGELRADELALAEELDARFATREWLEEGGGLRRPGVKIHEGVRVGEGAHKAPGGLIRCIATVRDDRLDDVAFSGDFTALPASVPSDLDAALVGCELDEAALLARVIDYYERVSPEIPGVGPSDWVAAVLQATTPQVPA